ncbi:MAG: hypothetical protein ABIN61_05250 [candidate division WOR-3 bacterium]
MTGDYDLVKEFLEFIEKVKETPSEEFYGLSPLQMFKLLTFEDFKSLSPFLQFNKNIPEEKLLKTPILDLEEKLVGILKANGGKLKLTKNKNLKLKDVNNLFFSCKIFENYEFHRGSEQKITSEEAVTHLFRIRNIITFNREFFEKGKRTLVFKEKEFIKHSSYERFLSYIDIAINSINWSYFYWDKFFYFIIQKGFLFSLYLLHKFGDIYRESEFYAQKFLEVFPLKSYWFSYDLPYYEEFFNEEEIEKLSRKDNEDERSLCYILRTFDLMEYFGFVDKKIEKEGPWRKKVFKKSEFFQDFVKFEVRMEIK